MSVGIIHISVVEASIISDADKQDTNPYALCGVGKASQRSPTIYGTLSPTWNHAMSFEVNNPEDLLLVTLWSSRTWFSDAFLGVLQIGLKRFRDGTPHQGWYKLGSKSQWEALKLSVSRTATITKPEAYMEAVKEEKSPGRVFLKILFDVREAWFIPPSLPSDLVLPTGTTGIGAELRPGAAAITDDTSTSSTSIVDRNVAAKKKGRRTGRTTDIIADGSSSGVADVTAAHAAAVAKIMSGDDDGHDHEGDDIEIGGLDEPITPAQAMITQQDAITVTRRRAIEADMVAMNGTGSSSLSSSPSGTTIGMSSLPAGSSTSSSTTPSPPSSHTLLVKSVSGAITSGSPSLDTTTTSSSRPPSPTAIARRLAFEEKWKTDIANAHAAAASSAHAHSMAVTAANAAAAQASAAEASLAKALIKAKKSKQVLIVMKDEVAKLTRESQASSEAARMRQQSSDDTIARLRAQIAELTDQHSKKDTALDQSLAQIAELELARTKLASEADTLQKEVAVARSSTGRQQKEYEDKLEELKRGVADSSSSSSRSYESRLKLTFGIADRESLLNLHVYEDGIMYIFNEFLCIDERASANNGNKPKRLRIPYAHIKRLKKRDFLKVVTSGSLSIYMTSAKVALKLEGLIDRAAAITDITNIATALSIAIEIR